MPSSTTTVTPDAAAAARPIIYLGMDVHKDSITTAMLPEGAKTPTRLDRLPNDLPKLRRWLERVARDGELRVCYEASSAGYVLHRALVQVATYASVYASQIHARETCFGHFPQRD